MEELGGLQSTGRKESDTTERHDLSFLTLSFKLTFSHSSLTLGKKLFSSSLLFAVRVVSSFISY